VRFDDFRSLVDRLAHEVPPEFRDGIVPAHEPVQATLVDD
jgi:hypothetical protein